MITLTGKKSGMSSSRSFPRGFDPSVLSRRPVRTWLRMAIGAVICFSLFPGATEAGVTTKAPGVKVDAAFNKLVKAALAEMEQSEDASIRQLHTLVIAAPATILIRPMTSDPATWHADGDHNRPHTDPADKRPKSEGRTKPTGAIIFIPREYLEPESKLWKSGTFAHELVHAIDFAYGRYNRDYTVRERRAVFIQNVWRDLYSAKLRKDYHGRFATLDYQAAVRAGTTGKLARYVFTRADFPLPP